MKKPSLLPFLLSTLPLLAWQDAPPPTSDKTPPFTAFAAKEKARLEAELPGIWTIVTYEAPGRAIDQQRVQGYILFQDGFVSITLQAQSLEQGVLGQELEIYFQGTVHRYRVNELLKLQFASVMGFSNMNEEGAIELIGNSYAREHQISLRDNLLTMTNEAGGRMVLRRVGKSDFPQTAIDFLRTRPADGR